MNMKEKLPKGYKEIRVCSKCGKQIRYSFSTTKTCPYCNGTIIIKVIKKK